MPKQISSNSQSGFIPLIIIIIAAAVVTLGTGAYITKKYQNNLKTQTKVSLEQTSTKAAHPPTGAPAGSAPAGQPAASSPPPPQPAAASKASPPAATSAPAKAPAATPAPAPAPAAPSLPDAKSYVQNFYYSYINNLYAYEAGAMSKSAVDIYAQANMSGSMYNTYQTAQGADPVLCAQNFTSNFNVSNQVGGSASLPIYTVTENFSQPSSFNVEMVWNGSKWVLNQAFC